MKRQVDNVGRVTLPSEFRKELDIKIGDYVDINLIGKNIVITNPTKENVKENIINILDELVYQSDSERIIKLIEYIKENL